jgi:hypothetical protein
MNNNVKKISFFVIVIAVSYVVFGFLIQDDEPSISISIKESNANIALNEVQKEFDDPGSFKSTLVLEAISADKNESFVGQTFKLEGNPDFDEIQIGIQDQKKLTARFFQNQTMLREASQSLLEEIPLNEAIKLSVSYFGEKGNQTKNNENTFQVRLFEGNGFFGDIGTLNVDLKGNAPMSSTINISALNEGVHPPFQLSEIKVWKDYESFD